MEGSQGDGPLDSCAALSHMVTLSPSCVILPTAEMTSAEAIAKTGDAFRKYLKKPYKKNDTKLFEDLSSRLIDAIPNAERLNRWHEERCTINPSGMNPGTHLYEIVNTLRDYLMGQEQS